MICIHVDGYRLYADEMHHVQSTERVGYNRLDKLHEMHTWLCVLQWEVQCVAARVAVCVAGCVAVRVAVRVAVCATVCVAVCVAMCTAACAAVCVAVYVARVHKVCIQTDKVS